MITIYKLMADVFRLSEHSVTKDTTLHNTVEWDSLKHMELIVAIESTYSIQLTGDEIAEMTSVVAIQSILEKHGL